MDVSFFCLLCMYNMSMYICIRMLSTVGTGVLICCIIVFVILNLKRKEKRNIQKQQPLGVNSRGQGSTLGSATGVNSRVKLQGS